MGTHRSISEQYLTAVTTTGSLRLVPVKKQWQCWRREKTDKDPVAWGKTEEEKCHMSWARGTVDRVSSTVFSVMTSESQEKSTSKDCRKGKETMSLSKIFYPKLL